MPTCMKKSYWKVYKMPPTLKKTNTIFKAIIKFLSIDRRLIDKKEKKISFSINSMKVFVCVSSSSQKKSFTNQWGKLSCGPIVWFSKLKPWSTLFLKKMRRIDCRINPRTLRQHCTAQYVYAVNANKRTVFPNKIRKKQALHTTWAETGA